MSSRVGVDKLRREADAAAARANAALSAFFLYNCTATVNSHSRAL
jgi:hypothetical protein